MRNLVRRRRQSKQRPLSLPRLLPLQAPRRRPGPHPEPKGIAPQARPRPPLSQRSGTACPLDPRTERGERSRILEQLDGRAWGLVPPPRPPQWRFARRFVWPHQASRQPLATPADRGTGGRTRGHGLRAPPMMFRFRWRSQARRRTQIRRLQLPVSTRAAARRLHQRPPLQLSSAKRQRRRSRHRLGGAS